MDHFYTDIKGWFSYKELYTEAVASVDDKKARFVEVGSFLGKSTAFMAVEIINAKKKGLIDFYCVDHWLGSEEHQELDVVKKSDLYFAFLRNIEPVRSVVHPIRAYSTEAAASFPDESIDFVLIDASHDFENVLQDLQAWFPKVKVGGVMAGDDFYWEGVKRACTEFFRDYGEIGYGKKDRKGQLMNWKVVKHG